MEGNDRMTVCAEEVCQEQSLRTVKTILPESHGIDTWLLMGFIYGLGREEGKALTKLDQLNGLSL